MIKRTTTKVTYRASSDIAFIKYWGKKNKTLRLPENGSLSMILNGLDTVTTVEFSQKLSKDDITIEGESDAKEVIRVVRHLDRVRALAKIELFAKVVSENNFPKATGLSSSGSGFAALTYAATRAAGLKLSEKEASILARQSSGTACRCICGGFVEWLDGETSPTSYSESIFPANYWDLRDVVVVVGEQKKKISSTRGHKSARSGKFYSVRQQHISEKIRRLKKFIKKKDFTNFGELVETEALEFHSILLTSQPPIIAWHPGTVEVMLAVQELRSHGLEAYFTINTGFNVHVLTLPKHEQQVRKKLESLPLVQKTLLAKVGEKPVEIKNHLF